MKKTLIFTHAASLALLALVFGCTPTDTEIDPDGIDTGTDTTDDPSDTSSDEPQDPRCADLGEVDFGIDECSTVLGGGVRNGMCVGEIKGCDDKGYDLFATVEECRETCHTRQDKCLAAGATWEIFSRNGDFICGQPPECPTPVCSDSPYKHGCNCGPGMRYDDTLGCVEDPTCVAPSCDDTVAVDFEYGNCSADLGWMVRDGACQYVQGCANLNYGFYRTRDDCNTACMTPQRICMESGGAWMGDVSLYPAKSQIYYDCGTEVQSADPPLPPCNCGPGKNYVDGVGCQDDGSCSVVSTSCPPASADFDDPAFYTETCGPMPVVNHYGLRSGICDIIFGCPADFEGPAAFVDPATWFPTQADCDAACSERCNTDADCVDPDPDDEEGVYCHFEDDSNCGAFTNGGICQTAAGFCSLQYDPICGCNGENVSSIACISVVGNPQRHDGECFDFPALP